MGGGVMGGGLMEGSVVGIHDVFLQFFHKISRELIFAFGHFSNNLRELFSEV